MMETIIIDKDRFVAVDGDKATVYSKTTLAKQIKQAEARLSEIPAMPSDEELLVWAKENYPKADYSREKQYLEAQISEAQQLLESI